MFSVSGNMVLGLFSGYSGPTLVHKRVRHDKCTWSHASPVLGWHCPHCSYISPSQKGNLKVHILNRHANPGERSFFRKISFSPKKFPNIFYKKKSFSFACMFCGKHLSSRSSLQVHISQVKAQGQGSLKPS